MNVKKCAVVIVVVVATAPAIIATGGCGNCEAEKDECDQSCYDFTGGVKCDEFNENKPDYVVGKPDCIQQREECIRHCSARACE